MFYFGTKKVVGPDDTVNKSDLLFCSLTDFYYYSSPNLVLLFKKLLSLIFLFSDLIFVYVVDKQSLSHNMKVFQKKVKIEKLVKTFCILIFGAKSEETFFRVTGDSCVYIFPSSLLIDCST